MEREPSHPERLPGKRWRGELLALQIELVKLQAWITATGGHRVLMDP